MKFKTTPFPHQLEIYERTKDAKSYALFLEMGTGKSLICIITAAHLFLEGKIDAIFIVAPGGGVSRNWVDYELPKHMPDAIAAKSAYFHYSTDKAANKKHAIEVDYVTKFPGLAVLSMSFDALITKKGAKAAGDFLKSRKCLYIVDESRRIKNPSADRTKYVLKSGRLALYKRLLTGTPCSNSPFDLYSQLLFLDESFWYPQGISTYSGFKQYFGIFEKGFVKGPNGLREFPLFVAYRNIEKLHGILDKIGTRLTKEEVLDLPPKLFSKQSYELNSDQKRFYTDLESDFMVIGDNNELITAPLAITRLLRFQQICSGYVPIDKVDEDYEFIELGSTNPKLSLLLDLCEDIPHKCIIWARFRKSIDIIMAKLGDKAVRYDGRTSQDERAAAQAAFQGSGGPQFFVANAATAGEGLTLTAAKTTLWYERTYDKAQEDQAAARNHRIGQNVAVNYVDLVASGTIDEEILECLNKKSMVSDMITHDSTRTKKCDTVQLCCL